MTSRRRIPISLLALMTTLLGGRAAGAQEVVSRRACEPFDLPAGHWAVDAVRRLEMAGLATVQFTRRALPACTALQVFDAVAGRALNEGPGAEAGFWRLLLLEEYPGLEFGEETTAAIGVIGASAQLGVATRQNSTAPGFGEFPPERTGSIPLADRSTGTAAGELSLSLPLGLVTTGTVGVDADGLRVDRADVSTGAGPIQISAGRTQVGYGRAVGGAVTLRSSVPLNRLELGLFRPVQLPGPARWLGSLTFTTFLGRTREDRHPGSPYLWGASGSISPHPRVMLAVHRAAFFGGEGEHRKITAARILDMVIGRIDGIGFENQIVSVEGSFRLPTEAFLPVTAFAEWGADDASGGWWSVPGLIMGVHLPYISGLPGVSAGFERASFGISTGGNPEWYRHWSFPGSWTLGGRPLGHPLGGNGSEWLAFANFNSPRDGLDLRAIGRKRFRGPENLYVPGRAGRSWEASAEGRWRPLGAPEIFGSMRAERGDDWSESEFSLGGRLFLN